MKIPDNLVRVFNGYTTFIDRAKDRKVLLKQSDRILEDGGFSRELLEAGVKAWPWRASVQTLTPLDFEQVCNVAGINQRRGYRNSELHDLGISSRPIPKSVTLRQDIISNKGERKVA